MKYPNEMLKEGQVWEDVSAGKNMAKWKVVHVQGKSVMLSRLLNRGEPDEHWGTPFKAHWYDFVPIMTDNAKLLDGPSLDLSEGCL